MDAPLLSEWLCEELCLWEDQNSGCVVGAPLWELLRRRMEEEGCDDQGLSAAMKEAVLDKLLAVPVAELQCVETGEPWLGGSGKALLAAEGRVTVRCAHRHFFTYIGYPALGTKGWLGKLFGEGAMLEAIIVAVHESRRDGCATVEYIYNNGKYNPGDVEVLLGCLRPWVACVPAHYWEDDEGLSKDQVLLVPLRYRLAHTLTILRQDNFAILWWDEVHTVADILKAAPGQLMFEVDLKRAYLATRSRILHPFIDAQVIWERILAFAVDEDRLERVAAPYRYGHTETESQILWDRAYRLKRMAPTLEERLMAATPRQISMYPAQGCIAALLEEAGGARPPIIGDWQGRYGLLRDQVLVLKKTLQTSAQRDGMIAEFAGTFLFLSGPEFQESNTVALRLEHLLCYLGRPARLYDVQKFFEELGMQSQLAGLIRKVRTRGVKLGFLLLDGKPRVGGELVALASMSAEVISRFRETLSRTGGLDMAVLDASHHVWTRDSPSMSLKCDEIFSRAQGYIPAFERRVECLHSLIYALNLPSSFTAAQLLPCLSPSQFAKLFVVGPLSFFPWQMDGQVVDAPLSTLPKRLRDLLLGSEALQEYRMLELTQYLSRMVGLGLLTVSSQNSSYSLASDVFFGEGEGSRSFSLHEEAQRILFWESLATKHGAIDSGWKVPPALATPVVERLKRWAFTRGLHDLAGIATDAQVSVNQVKEWLGDFASPTQDEAIGRAFADFRSGGPGDAGAADDDDNHDLSHHHDDNDDPSVLILESDDPNKYGRGKRRRHIKSVVRWISDGHGDDYHDYKDDDDDEDGANYHEDEGEEQSDDDGDDDDDDGDDDDDDLLDGSMDSDPLKESFSSLLEDSFDKRPKVRKSVKSSKKKRGRPKRNPTGSPKKRRPRDTSYSDDVILESGSSSEEFSRRIALELAEDEENVTGAGYAPTATRVKRPKKARSSEKRAKKTEKASRSKRTGSKKRKKSTRTNTDVPSRPSAKEFSSWGVNREKEYRKKMNDASFLNTLHLVLKRHSVSSRSGLRLEVDWDAVKDELRLESGRYVQELVSFCQEHNPSFREAMCLVRNAKAEDNPILPSSLAKLSEKIHIKPQPSKRLPKAERAFEALRMLCFTEESAQDEDVWEELKNFVGAHAVSRAASEMGQAYLISKNNRWGFKPSTTWSSALEPSYLDLSLYKNASVWDLSSKGEQDDTATATSGLQLLDQEDGHVPYQAADALAFHALHNVASGSFTLELEWKGAYHHEKSRGRSTDVFLRRAAKWEQTTPLTQDAVSDQVASLRREPMKPKILDRVKADEEDGTPLGVLLAVFEPVDAMWAMMEMCFDDPPSVFGVSAQDDVHFVALEFSHAYSFEGTLIQPSFDLMGNSIKWRNLLRALVDLVMRYPRITLQGLERKSYVGCGLVWKLMSSLVRGRVVRFEVHPVEAGSQFHHQLSSPKHQVEFLAEDSAMTHLDALLNK